MKKIGMLTIGQTPRNDIIPSLLEIMGNNYEIVEAGALDEMTLTDVKKMEMRPDDYILVSRMRDGTEIKIAKRALLPLLQSRIHHLEEKGVRLTVLMCTGKFPQFDSKGLIVTPSEILHGVVDGAIKKGRLAVVFPAKEQITYINREFAKEGIELYGDWLSPYEGDGDLDALCARIKAWKPNLVFLNCFGFTRKVKNAVEKATGVPALQSNAMIARVLNELA
jgi:protein AroM